MSDPKRFLFDADATAAEKELIESWKREQPSTDARDKTLAMLGIGGASIGAAAAAAGSSVAPKALTAWTSLALAKWLAIGALAAGLTVAGFLSLRNVNKPSPMTPPSLGPVSEPTLVTPPPVVAPPAVPAPEAPPAVQLKSPVTPKASRAPRTEARSDEGTLAQQIAALDSARAALVGGDAARAEQLVNEYEARFPSGSFVEEAEVLRIEILLRQGDRTGASRVGTRFLTAHPTSPHAARVRALLGSAAP